MNQTLQVAANLRPGDFLVYADGSIMQIDNGQLSCSHFVPTIRYTRDGEALSTPERGRGIPSGMSVLPLSEAEAERMLAQLKHPKQSPPKSKPVATPAATPATTKTPSPSPVIRGRYAKRTSWRQNYTEWKQGWDLRNQQESTQ